MIVSNVDIGSGPGVGDGDSLYTAFDKVNHNFANVLSNVNNLTNSVSTVAGRTGNVVLTVNDIIGLSNAYAIASSTATANTAMRGYVDTKIAANIAALINGAPGALDTLEELAAALGNNASFSATIINSLATTNSNLITANTSMRGYLDGQILAANSGITSAVTLANTGMKGYVDYNSLVQSTEIANANVAMKGYVDQANSIQSAQISLANIGLKGYIDQANTIQSAQISAANIGIKGYIDQANTIQSGQVGAANLAIIAANLGMKGYVDSVATLSIYSNVNTKAYTESMGFSNYSNSNVRSYLTGGFDGNIIPSANVTYSLGTPTRQWKDLYVSNNTIYIGGTPLSSTPGGLTFAGVPVSSFAPTAATTVTPGTVWNFANTVRASSQLVFPAYGSGKFVIVEAGTYGGSPLPNIGMYSTDGATWTTMYLPNVATQVQTIAYGAGKFVVPYAGGQGVGNGPVAYSEDGINWTLKSNAIPFVEYTGSPGTNNCTWTKTGAAYGNGRFVLLSAVGARTVISTDGINWSNGSAYGSTLYGSSNPLPLTDGQGYSLYYHSLTFDNGWFLASALRQSGTGANVFAYSSDGINWTRTQLSIGAQPGYTGSYLLGSGGGVFIAIPASGTIGLRSTDNGRTWSNINIPSAYTYTSVTYGGGAFILTPSGGAGSYPSSGAGNANVALSTDGGITWSSVPTPYNAYYGGGAYGAGTFIAAGNWYGNVLNVSYSNSVGALTLAPTLPGTIDRVDIGTSTPGSGAFTSLSADSLSTTGDISAGNIATGNITTPGGNLTITGNVTNTGNITILQYLKGPPGGNLNISSPTTQSGNLNILQYLNGPPSGNLVIGSPVTQSGNLNILQYLNGPPSGNLVIGSPVTHNGNITVLQYLNGPPNSNLRISSPTVITGNVTANYFVGNGSQLTSLPGYAYSNVNVASYLSSQGIGGGNYSNVNVAAYTQTMGYQNFGNVNVASYLAGNVTVGNISATYFTGNGSQLTGLPSGYSNVQVKSFLATGDGASRLIQGYYANIDLGATAQLFSFGATAKSYFGHDGTLGNTSINYIRADNGDVRIATNNAAKTWTFDNTGLLTFAGTLTSGATFDGNDFIAAPNSFIELAGYTANTYVGLDNNSVFIQTNWNTAGKQWTFANTGSIIFPDSTVQTTAYTGAGGSNYSNANVTAYTVTMGFTNFSNVNVAAYVTTANSAILGYIDQANTIQSAQVGAANLAITTANVGMKGYVDSQSFYSNAKVATYLQYGNISNVSLAGNVTATYFLGNGALLTGIIASSGGTNYSNTNVIAYLNATGYNLYSNANVTTYLPTYSGNIANVRLGTSGVLTFADGTTMTTAASGGGGNYGNANVTAYTVSMGFTNFSNVNVAALITTNGLTNYSNANIQSFVTTNGLTNYSNVNTAAYLNSQGYNLYSNANVASYLPTYSGNISNVRLGPSGNITFADGTAQTSAYSNINLIANLRVSSVTVGNLTVLGALNTTLDIGNSFVSLATNNIGNTNDIGFYGQYNAGQGNVYTGLAYTASDGIYRLYSNLTPEPSTTITLANIRYSNIQVGNILAANVTVNSVIASNVYVNGNIIAGNATIAGIVLTNNSIYSSQTAVDIQFGSLSATANIVMNRNVVHNRDINVIGNVIANNISILGNITGNINGYTIGYRDMPQITAANLTLIASDAGKHYYATNTSPTTLTIPLNSSVAFALGTVITVVNQGTGNITIARGTCTLYLAGNSTIASRTITSYGVGTLLKVATDTWFINGNGVV